MALRVDVPAVPVSKVEQSARRVEVVVGDELVVRLGGEADAGYVAELIGRLRATTC